MINFVTEESFWELFPEATIGVLTVDGIKPTDQIDPELVARAQKELKRANIVARKWVPNNPISKNEVPAVWREAYRKFKTKHGARCSIENLLKRVLKDNPVGSINPAVDVSNAVSLTYAFPMGVENIDAFVGTFRLALSEGGDDYLAVGEDTPDPTLAGELAYLDDAGAICRCWNWRDCQRSAATDNTPHCAFIMECIEPHRVNDLHAAINQLEVFTSEILGAHTTNKDYLTIDHRTTPLI